MLGLTNASVFTARVVGLGVAVLGAVVFGLSLAAWLRAITAARGWVARPALVVSFVLLGALLVFSIFPRLYPTMASPACRCCCWRLRCWLLCGAALPGPPGICWQ